MKPTEQMILNLGRQGHPLARSIQPEEVLELIRALLSRFSTFKEELDLSPNSLKRLEVMLHEFYKKNPTLGGDELVALIREVTAYTGQVLIIHAGGSWYPKDPTLWHTSILINSPRESKKDRERYVSPSVNIVVGALVAWTWDSFAENSKPHLYRLYRQVLSKGVREKL